MNLTLREKIKALLLEHGAMTAREMAAFAKGHPESALGRMACQMKKDGYIHLVGWSNIRKDRLPIRVYALTDPEKLLPEEHIKQALAGGHKTSVALHELMPGIPKPAFQSLLRYMRESGAIHRQRFGNFALYRLAGMPPATEDDLVVLELESEPADAGRDPIKRSLLETRMTETAALYDRLFGDYVRARRAA